MNRILVIIMVIGIAVMLINEYKEVPQLSKDALEEKIWELEMKNEELESENQYLLEKISCLEEELREAQNELECMRDDYNEDIGLLERLLEENGIELPYSHGEMIITKPKK